MAIRDGRAHAQPKEPPPGHRPRLSVGFILADNFTLSAFSLFVDQLRLAADEGDFSRQINCQWTIMSARAEPVRASCGVEISRTTAFLDPKRFDYIAVVGGILHGGRQVDEASIDYLRHAAKLGVPLDKTDRSVTDIALEAGFSDCAHFSRHWIHAGVEADVPEAGDVYVVDIGRASVLITSGDDEMIRAFHNVCRHRGARLVDAAKDTVGKLVCRYHAWTYDLDGSLLRAEQMGEGFDTSCHGLKPVHLKSIEGLLFICLAEEPPTDIDQLAHDMGPYIAPHAPRNTKIAYQADIIELGNWKITMENNRECYHCAGNHPELAVPLFEYGFGFAPDSMDAAKAREAHRYECLVSDLHATWETDGLPSRQIDHLDDRVTGFRTQRLLIDREGESQTMDTRIASRELLGQFTNPKLGGLSFWTQPNSWHHFMSDHIVTFSVIPLAPDRTLVRTKWLVHKDAVEGIDYDLKRLTEVWLATNDQDAALVGLQQAGLKSPAYEPGPYSPFTEGLVDKFINWYCGRLKAYL